MVYFIRQGDSDYYKIGLSRDFERRLSKLQIASPFELSIITLLAVKPSTGNAMLEADLHRLLTQHRMRGEWFCLPMLSEMPVSIIKGWLLELEFVAYDIMVRDDIPVLLVRKLQSAHERKTTISKIDGCILAHMGAYEQAGVCFDDIIRLLPEYDSDEIAQSVNGLVGRGHLYKREGSGTQTRFFMYKKKQEPRVIYYHYGEQA